MAGDPPKCICVQVETKYGWETVGHPECPAHESTSTICLSATSFPGKLSIPKRFGPLMKPGQKTPSRMKYESRLARKAATDEGEGRR